METKFVILVGVIAVYKNKILLTQRSLKSNFMPGAWGLPCGKIEYGEELEDAVFRELFEETQLSGSISKMVGSSKFIGIKDGIQIHNTQINFIVETETNNVVTDYSSETSKWVDLEDIFSIGLDDFTIKTIIQAIPYLSKTGFKLIDELVFEIEKLNWSEPNIIINEVATILEKYYDRIEEFKSDLKNTSPATFSNLISHSYDLPSHTKWFLYKSKQQGFSIWINQFKSERKYGYANSIHNHRYWFASIPLCGKLVQTIHEIKIVNNVLTDNKIRKEIINEGKSYFLSPFEVHSFDEIEKDTVTLIVRSKAVSAFSESYNLKDNSVKKHFSFSSRFEDFKDIL